MRRTLLPLGLAFLAEISLFGTILVLSAGEPKLEEFSRGSPWIRRPIRREIKSRLSELLPEGSIEGKYQEQARILAAIDIRKDPLDFRFEHFAKDLSDIRPGFYRFDPFAFPEQLPEEWLPPGEERPLTPTAVLSRAAAATRANVCLSMEVRGVFYTPAERRVQIAPRGTTSLPLSTRTLQEGATMPLGLLDRIPEGRLFRDPAMIWGLLRVEKIRQGYVLFKVGAYFMRDPENVVYEPLTYYYDSTIGQYRCNP